MLTRDASGRLIEVLARLSEQVGAATTPLEAAEAALQAADELLGWDAAYVDLYDEATGLLLPLVNYDEIGGVRTAVAPAPVDPEQVPAVKAILNAGPRLILREPVLTKPGATAPFGDTERPSLSLMFVPIKRGEKYVGIFSIQSYQYQAYDQASLDVLRVLSLCCAGALERSMAEQRLQQTEQEVTLLLQQTPIILWTTDRSLHVTKSLGLGLELAGLKPDQFLGAPVPGLTARIAHRAALDGTAGQYEFEFSNRVFQCYVSPLGDPASPPVGCLGVAYDITERKRAEEQLRVLALEDSLTRLPNRVAFLEALERAVAHAERRPGYTFAVAFIDLDRFKIVNDSLGHSFGDELLQKVGDRLRRCVRPGDVVARLGGDEFTILFDDLKSPDDATVIVQRIMECLERPVKLHGEDVTVAFSVGLALSGPAYTDAREILRDADIAMYRAKESGGSRCEIFDQEMHRRAVSRLRLEQALRVAVDQSQLVLHYQPIVRLPHGTISGFEALVRWHDPQRGLISPAEFIPVAEETGLIIRLGEWVTREACRWLKEVHDSFPEYRNLSISVNVSARQFIHPDLAEVIRTILQETELTPDCLKLEITESVLMDNQDATMRTLRALQSLDVKLHMDDFGTGYSSLAYLHQFPVAALKIDRSFVKELGTEGENPEITRAIIALAHSMNMKPIAEGIETAVQVERLHQLGCEFGQGYFFAHPMPAPDALSFLRSSTTGR